MLDAAVEIGISLFLAAPEQDDPELESKLLTGGFPPWLAARLLFFVPLAFGRRLLGECQLANAYTAGGQQHPLEEDPVWRAVTARAAQASRDEIGALAPRSSEISAVNSFLESHPDRADALGELQLSAPTRVNALPPIEASEAPEPPEAPEAKRDGASIGDGGVPSPALAFRRYLEGHGHAVREDGGALFTGELRFGARVFPRPAAKWPQVQVDFYVAHPSLAAPYLLESFAGAGERWGDALRQTIVKFERGSLHVLIAGLLDRGSCADQVEWEPLGDAPFELCLGGALQTFGPAKAPRLAALIDRLKSALAAAALTAKVHGLRVFLAHDGARLTVVEVLLDNELWPPGVQLAEAMDWSGRDAAKGENEGEQDDAKGGWGVRWFAMVVPRAAA